MIRNDRGSALIATPAGIVRAQLSARLLKAARGSPEMPAVGDWVAITVLGEGQAGQTGGGLRIGKDEQRSLRRRVVPAWSC